MSGGVGSSITAAALDRALALVNEANGLLSVVEQSQADAAEVARAVATAEAAAGIASAKQVEAAALADQARANAVETSRDAASARTSAEGIEAARTAAAGSATQAAGSLAAVLAGVSALVGGADSAHDTLGKLAVLLSTHSGAVDNPHAVTAAQVGAYTREQADLAIADLRAALKAADIGDASADGRAILKAANFAAIRVLLGLVVGTNVQAQSSTLDALSGLPTTPFGRALLAQASAADTRTTLQLGTAATLAAGVAGGVATLDPSTGRLLATQVPEFLLGAMRYQSGWNAATNSPVIPAPAAANNGWYYLVTVAGTTSLPGPFGAITDWQVGDWAVSNGTYWEKVDSSDQVVSVAGLQGTITKSDLKAALAIGVADIADASASGRSLISAADYPAMRALLGLVVGTNVQAYNAGLASIAALSTTAYGRSLLTLADGSALKSALAIAAADISDASASGRALIKATDYAAMRGLLSLVIGTHVQAWDADLDALAALSTTAFGRSLLTMADATAAKNALGAPYVVAQVRGNPWYQKWSDGVIIQGGYSNDSSGTDPTITLPVTLTQEFTAAFCCFANQSSPTTNIQAVNPASITNSSFVARRRFYNQSVVGIANEPFFWWVKGA